MCMCWVGASLIGLQGSIQLERSSVMAEAFRKKNEDIEKVLRRFKKQVKNEGILDVVRDHERYEKPSQAKKKNMELAKIRNWARQREEEY